MNFITLFLNNLIILLNLITGTPTAKHSLHKKPTKTDLQRSLNCWIARNFYIICFAAIAILLIIFVIVCYAIVGVSATESNMHYYHLGDIA